MEHENEHLDIREKLLRLPKIQADENFLKRLQIQIDILDSEERTRDVVEKGSVSGYFKNLFGARLMPALGITSVIVVAVLVYFVLADKKDSVVNNLAGNKNQETIITKEKPEDKKTSPQNETKELAKNDVNTQTPSTNSLNGNKTESDNISKDKTAPKEKIQELTSKTEGVVSDERGGQINIRGGRTSENNIVLDKIKQQVEPTKKPDEKQTEAEKKDTPKTEAPMTSTDSEKSIKEGGRGGVTDPTKSRSSIKPKKKEPNEVIDINKSVLESLRDKLK
ncbi:MAG: hypothetical protein JSS63_09210 [Bacteroidetes bacterium]|nr:hypothetical protein [Bacteroidota bacterium]